MRTDVPPSRFGYIVIAAGTVLSIVSAIVPFYTAGYQLQFAVLMAGITPYLVYGLVVYWLRRPISSVAGALLLVAHLWLVVHERYQRRRLFRPYDLCRAAAFCRLAYSAAGRGHASTLA
jgi:hypothetical protein